MSQIKLFGYWLPVHDDASARDAVRMSGLPVLFMGANAAVFALMEAVQPAPSTSLLASSLAISCILILLAFRIRAGHAAWMPLVVILFVVFLAASAFLTYLGWHLTGRAQAGAIQAVFSWIIPIICLVLVVGGVRGWRWLNSHEGKLSF
jgi:uncharacterized membrane protein